MFLSTILLGCDHHSVSYDKQSQKTVADILEKAGHQVEILSVGPNHTQSAMGKKKNKGKVAIYMVNGADLQTYKDFAQGIKQGYYHVKYAYFGLQGYINSKTCSCNGAKTAKLKKAHDDASSDSYTRDLWGMTTAEVCEKYKAQIAYACGSSREDLGENLVKVIGGSTNSSNNSSNSSSNCKEALKDVLYNWDGEVECFLRDDTVHIRKIPSPHNATLSLIEGQNIDYDSVSVTDYNPSTVNYLTSSFDGYDLTIQDDYLIKRFGKISSSVSIDSEVTSLKDAKAFLQREWNKLKRDNGHSLEVKTAGDSKWKQGEWCRVYLPSFNIDDYMYIVKVSQDDSNDWKCNLTLVDYPPGFGKPTNANNEEDSNSDGEESS